MSDPNDFQYKDQVDHPKHYAESGIEPADVIEAWGLDFFTGNCVKYVARAGKKPNEPEIKDIEKAIWYLQKKVKILKAKDAKDAQKTNSGN